MGDRRNAFLWAIGWWLLRRQLRRRVASRFVGAATAPSPRRGKKLLGVIAFMGLIGGGLVIWRKLAAETSGRTAPPREPVVVTKERAPDVA